MNEAAFDHFIEQMGLMAQADGQPRIAGQMLGYLLIEGEARSLNQMTEALQISKASASTNARLLEQRGLLRRLAPMGSRQDLYEAVSQPHRQMLQTMSERFLANARTITEISDTFPRDRCDAIARVNAFADFYRESAIFFSKWYQHTSEDAGQQTGFDAKE